MRIIPSRRASFSPSPSAPALLPTDQNQLATPGNLSQWKPQCVCPAAYRKSGPVQSLGNGVDAVRTQDERSELFVPFGRPRPSWRPCHFPFAFSPTWTPLLLNILPSMTDLLSRCPRQRLRLSAGDSETNRGQGYFPFAFSPRWTSWRMASGRSSFTS